MKKKRKTTSSSNHKHLPSDIASINELTVILKIICQYDITTKNNKGLLLSWSYSSWNTEKSQYKEPVN
jgi:hypothetical protein